MFKTSFGKTVADRVVDKVDESIKADVMHWVAVYVSCNPAVSFLDKSLMSCSQEVRMRIGSKKIFHLEAWVIKVMSLYKVQSSVYWPSQML